MKRSIQGPLASERQVNQCETELQNVRTQAQGEKERIDGQFTAVRRDVHRLESRVGGAEGEIEQVRRQVDGAARETAKVKRQVDSVDGKVLRVSRQVDKTARETAQVKRKVGSVDGKVQGVSKQADDLENEMRQIKAEMREMEQLQQQQLTRPIYIQPIIVNDGAIRINMSDNATRDRSALQALVTELRAQLTQLRLESSRPQLENEYGSESESEDTVYEMRCQRY